MAINLKALNIGLGKGKAADKARRSKAPAKKAPVAGELDLDPRGGRRPKKAAPLLPASRSAPRCRSLLIALGFLVFVIAVVGWLAIRTTSNGTAYISAAGQMRMLSQRLAKESQQGLQGSAATRSRASSQARDEFAGLVEALTTGGKVGDIEVPASGRERQADARQGHAALAEDRTRTSAWCSAQQKNLVALGNAVKAINDNNPVLLDLAEQVSALKLQAQAGSREISLAGQLVMLTQRMAKNANALLASDVIDPEVTFLLGKDSNTFRDIVHGLTKGSDALRVSRRARPRDAGEAEGARRRLSASTARR